jgi:hypothetical protein
VILAAEALNRAELADESIGGVTRAVLRPSAVAITMPRISPIAQPGGPDVAT